MVGCWLGFAKHIHEFVIFLGDIQDGGWVGTLHGHGCDSQMWQLPTVGVTVLKPLGNVRKSGDRGDSSRGYGMPGGDRNKKKHTECLLCK